MEILVVDGVEMTWICPVKVEAMLSKKRMRTWAEKDGAEMAWISRMEQERPGMDGVSMNWIWISQVGEQPQARVREETLEDFLPRLRWEHQQLFGGNRLPMYLASMSLPVPSRVRWS
mmetsp:Transcript_4441/g.16203  ORF Transcript_4441/g.16203 Transcript_4441/m.16203 type:complete len:117 (-) Transcript_4441:2877-3227(-)